MTPSELQSEARDIVRKMMPQIPLPDQEEIVKDVYEAICRYNLLRTATIGEVARFMLKGAAELAEPKSVVCEHPKENVECIANLEYPGGSISWCKNCGAWKDDELCEWHLPRRRS